MISHSHRCISIHIPKSAGNSVNRAFGVDWQDHKDIARHRAELPADVFNSYFKFAVVRNPWDRLLSDYNYQLRKSRPAESKLHLYDERRTGRSFAQCVEAVLAQSHPYPASSWGGDVSPGIHRFSPQLDWITIDGIQAVDYVARFESLDDDFRVVAQAAGLECSRLPRRNRRFHFHYSRYYDSSTRDAVGQFYARDIAAFNYEFEDRRIRFPWFGCKPAQRALIPTQVFPAEHPRLAAVVTGGGTSPKS